MWKNGVMEQEDSPVNGHHSSVNRLASLPEIRMTESDLQFLKAKANLPVPNKLGLSGEDRSIASTKVPFGVTAKRTVKSKAT